ncbi:MAG: hypothetical protein AB2693_25095 [Candidatus Thiodiazotropha sp.]
MLNYSAPKGVAAEPRRPGNELAYRVHKGHVDFQRYRHIDGNGIVCMALLW